MNVRMLQRFKKIKDVTSSVLSVFSVETNHLHTYPNFTKNTFDVDRGPYRSLEEHHLTYFRDVLGENGLVVDLCDLEKYNVDFMKHLRGGSTLVLRPTATEQVSKILSFCNHHHLAVCTQGGNTGICGGATPIFDEIILSMELMNKIIHLDELSSVLTCEAGCVLENLDHYLNERNLMMPIDLGAKGSCHIGGNISTNAGGIRLYRYGNLQGNILGLEVVKANGEILNCMNTLKKDNTGFHLKHLFIGSEGTLGIITKAAIQCVPKPKSVKLLFLGAQNFTKILKAFNKARHDLGEIISAVEVMDHQTMEMVEEYTDLSSPIGRYPIYLIIETSGSDETHDEEKLNRYFESCMDKHFILNGVVASSTTQIQKLWSIREKIAESFYKDGYVFSYDISLPLPSYYDFVTEMRHYMGEKSHRVFGFGHLGDGNLHLQISVKEFSKEILDYIEPHIYKRVEELKGSISAEHGIGFLKRKYLPMIKSSVNISTMRNLKNLMDPKGILNPYKVL
ncbi:D-2-hydroxyglutarate dehydrogenase, mitochondrial-like [Coccinella septempunctata]|uniref:D-2-hydroxyglutarate dehydrogenase, mitochondrial-like n=1 Tax=Coccinella septempunctata TaxID=41139 RepID=UPI001D082671|nr:D-2-hydroxyglutarate dehydrogenase, mitochondrial-like [Coccinella septempunctata]